MKHSNISFFIPHNGCPNKCSFCNQKNITGQSYQPNAADIERTLEKAASDMGERARQAEIAFFGGSFTALDRDYMVSLLRAAKPYLGVFSGIRISTRPDCIDDEILSILKSYGVTSIELGAQSMDNAVLNVNNRGHSAADVVISCEKIKKAGFSLGLQMMTGLYGSTVEKDICTAEKFTELNPDTVRIYPTVIMKDTDLAQYYLSGRYVPYSLEQSVALCSKLILMFEKAGIRIIRLGLHYSESLEKNSLGGNYHPAFKELCESKIFLDKLLEFLENTGKKEITVAINRKSLSKFLGQKKSNYNYLTAMGYKVNITYDDSLGKYEMNIT